jgi:Cupin-like domain
MSSTVQIARASALVPEQFVRDHLQGVGTPLVVTDATDRWPAREKWTFESLKTAYGDDLVCPMFGSRSGVGKITKLATYIDYLDHPDQELPGFPTNVADRTALAGTAAVPERRPYLTDWNAFQKHPELYEDIAPPFYFVDDWTSALSVGVRDVIQRVLRRVYYCDVLVGPVEARSALHYDFGHTHSCLSQIRGRKRALLFSPRDSALLYDGRVDPEAPDLARFEAFAHATMYEAILEPGDVLFIPADWWHSVRTLETSITVGHSFFNRANVSAHLEDLLPRLLANSNSG